MSTTSSVDRTGRDTDSGGYLTTWRGQVVVLWLGAVVAVFVGLFHIFPAPEYLEKAPYLGVMFLLGGLAPFAAAVAMVVPRFSAGLRRLAIQLMALVSALMIVMGVISRITGMPGVEQEPWDSFIIISLGLEAAFLGLTPVLLGRR